MTVPTLRDVHLVRPLNDAEVLLGKDHLVRAWVGRLGAAGNLSGDLTELSPGGVVGTPGPLVFFPLPGPAGHYAANVRAEPGKYYRLRVTAADAAVPADATTQEFNFTATPGTRLGPALSGIAAVPATGAVSWTTAPATPSGQVNWSTSPLLEPLSVASESFSGLRTAHAATLGPLVVGTRYFFRVWQVAQDGSSTMSPLQTFVAA